MAYSNDINPDYTDKDIKTLRDIYRQNEGGTILIVGNYPISNWIGWEIELAAIINQAVEKYYPKIYDYN